MRIGELAKRSGVSSSAIRYYEAAGLLPKAPRISGVRVYSARTVDTLAMIARAKDAGFRLDEVRVLMAAGDGTPAGGAWRESVVQKLAEVELTQRQLNAQRELLTRLLECRCADADTCRRRMRNSFSAGLSESNDADGPGSLLEHL